MLPYQNLASLENYSDSMGETASFTLTGELHAYEGRKYLLPTMFLVNKATDLVLPTQ